ncbi:MAG: methyltransferase domain-containing protein, partial [Sandaracinobacteroides sp.]
VLAIDVAAAALDAARARNIDQPNVRFEEGSFPGSMPSQMPAGGFDLILLSELLYYLCPETLVEAARLAAAVARPGADILLVHWLGPTPDYPLSGNEAAGQFIAALGSDVELLLHRSMPDYRIDLLRRSASR